MYARQDTECWPGRKKLAKEWGCDPSKISRLNTELENLGYITRVRRYGTSSLTIIEDEEQIPRLQKLAKEKQDRRKNATTEQPCECRKSETLNVAEMRHGSSQKCDVEEEAVQEESDQEKAAKEPAPTGAEPEPPSPAQERLAGLRSRLGSDPFTMAANCAAAQEKEGHIWTVPVEAGGTDTAGELMLSAWLKTKGVDPAQVPKLVTDKWRLRLSKLAQTLESITPQQAARAVELVLDKRNPEFNYYTYSDPAIEKFKRDWTEVALRLLSGQPGYLTARPPGDNGGQESGPDKVRRVMQQRGLLS